MNERDPMTPATGPRFRIDQASTLLLQVNQSRFDVGHLERDVMQTLAVTFYETPHRRVPVQRLQQLNMGATDRDHRLFHPLGFDDFAIQRLDSVLLPKPLESNIEIGHGQRSVMNVEQEHALERTGTTTSLFMSDPPVTSPHALWLETGD